MKYFAIRDKKAEIFGQVFPSTTFGTAERSFSESINSADSPHGKFPEDFALFYMFDLNEETGVIDYSVDNDGNIIPITPQLISEASNLIK